MSFCLNAQQLPLYSKYSFNRFALNPAYAGNKNRIEAIATHRNHLMGFEGAPTTQLVSVTAPIQKRYIGLGLRIMSDQIGATSQGSAVVAGNYFIGFGPGRLAMGFELGVHTYQIDWESIVKRHDNDAAIPTENRTIAVPDGGFGIFFNSENFYFGYSIQHMIRSKLKYTDIETESIARFRMHHYINTGAVFELNESINIEPHLLLKMVKAAPWQLDIGGYAIYRNMIGVGVGYRTGDAIFFTSKIEVKQQFYVGYSYGMRIGQLATYSASSHEVMFGYFYKLLEPARKKIIHPRYYF
jgi:type IX secretion system PorP/SprF family membrane protein